MPAAGDPPQWLADRGGHYDSLKVTDGADPQLDTVVLDDGNRQLWFGTAPARPSPALRLSENTRPLSLPRALDRDVVAWSRAEKGRTEREKDGKHRSFPVTPDTGSHPRKRR